MTGSTLLIAVLQQATLTGVVRDAAGLEPVAFAHVTVTPAVVAGIPPTAVSDRFGAFVVPGVPAAPSVRVEVEAFGYALWTRTYDAPPGEPIRVLLSPAPVGLEGLEAAAGGRAGDPIALSRDAFVVDSVVIRSLPAILETDALRAIAASPSASAASDYASVPLVRGGTSEGTPVLLDGVRLFNAFHLGGFVSAVNAEVVERATLLTGSGGDGFATGSLSGAIDIATRDGSRDRRRIAGSLGLASSRFSVEGPIGGDMSFLLDGRRTYVDGLSLALKTIGIADDHVPYSFQDLHAKVTSDLGGVRRLSVSGYLNAEALEDVDARWRWTRETDMEWGNAALSVHYRDRFGTNGIIDANLGHSRFTSDLIRLHLDHVAADEGTLREPPDTILFGDGSMSETSAGLRVTWHAGGATVKSGIRATRFEGDHDYHAADRYFSVRDVSTFVTFALRESRWRLAAHSILEVPLRRGFSTRAGLRVDRFQGLETAFAPFAELSHAASWWKARVSASRSHQALASVRNEEALLASFLAYDLLIPVGEAPVPRNTEFSVGWEGSRRGLRIRLDAYARKLDNLRLPRLADSPVRATVLGDPSSWELSSGTARGIEASGSWAGDRGLSVLGSYRWAAVTRTVGPRTYTPRFHRDHELELGSSYGRGTSSWSARVSLRSGQRDTPILAVVPVTTHRGSEIDHVPLAGEYNSGRLPRYVRIDVGWRGDREVSWFGGGSLAPYVSVANLFGFPNVVGWVMEEDETGPTLRKVYRRQLPTIPFAGVEFRF
ncbi:MAG: TonB-dependent receptor [Gemmatimonadota bacterium]|nr:TonB-dependent receptor [Gemmatimonadota bacterium]